MDTPGIGETLVSPRTHAHRLGAEIQSEDTRPVPDRRRPVGRPGVVRDAAAAFAARLRQTSSPAEIEALWATEVAAYAGKADRTIKRIIAEHHRPAVRAALGADHPALAVVKLPAEAADRIRADDIARVAALHRHLGRNRVSPTVAVPRWREIVERATALLASDAPLDLVAGLLLATGRRPYEVCCTGRFAPAPLPGGKPGARSRWTVLFSGQAKTKGRPGTRHDTAYKIPVLAEARRVIAALDASRTSPEGRAWAGMTNDQFRATTLRLALTEAVMRAYGDLWPSRSDPSPKGVNGEGRSPPKGAKLRRRQGRRSRPMALDAEGRPARLPRPTPAPRRDRPQAVRPREMIRITPAVSWTPPISGPSRRYARDDGSAPGRSPSGRE